MSILDNVGAETTPDENAEYLGEDDQFQTEFPGIFEFLSRVKINGEKRKPGRLIIYYEPGKAHLCFSDKHTGSVAWHAAGSVAEALLGAENRLQGKGLDWRRDKRARY